MNRGSSWLALALTLILVGCGPAEEAGMDEMEGEPAGQMESGMAGDAMEAGDSAMMEDEMGEEMEEGGMEEGMPEEMMPDSSGAMSGGG